MKTLFSRPIGLLLLCALVLPSCATSQERDKYRMQVVRNELRIGKTSVELHGVNKPDFIASAKSDGDMIVTLNELAKVGGNTVMVTLWGYSADGVTIAPEAVSQFKRASAHTLEHRMGLVCKVFPDDAPADLAWRRNAAHCAAAAFAEDLECLWLVDGPHAADVIAIFQADAPLLAIAAPEGGDLKMITQASDAPADKPALLVGDFSPEPLWDILHFVAPDGPDTYARLDAGEALPHQREPWTPDNSSLTEQERADGWIALFDGKTFNGWDMTGDNKDGWIVRDGLIEWNGGGGGYVQTHDRYSDFILRLDWTIEQGGNSGVHIRQPREGRASKIGMEIQIMGDYGVAPNKNGTGAVYDVIPPRVNASSPAMEWNTYEIRAEGPHLQVTLNGELVQDVNLDEHPILKYRLREGFIALQDHGKYAAYRNIKIKPL